MQHLVDAVRQSVADKNWYAALTVALTLPDIAARLDGRSGRSGERYVSWFNDYLLKKYTVVYSPTESSVFLNGKDCYALRCAFLHEGDFQITSQPIRTVLNDFKFVMPSGGSRHNNLYDMSKVSLELQVDTFCGEICDAVEEWLVVKGSDPIIAAQLVDLPKIDFS